MGTEGFGKNWLNRGENRREMFKFGNRRVRESGNNNFEKINQKRFSDTVLNQNIFVKIVELGGKEGISKNFKNFLGF